MPRPNPYDNPDLVKLMIKVARKGAAVTYTYKRDIVIVPELIGSRIGIHNGKSFIVKTIEREMVGKKLGEYSETRRFRGHGKTKGRH
ncbi:MAG: ribosomal protein S19 family protein [Candidatus Moeniiplasma glomeromycotorum]|nr:ribosomal protein S19 family protein [Candidatus Moeniiplasma glomeromycotorum]MCE8167139.1 ribosomal protein S19 family protein [Candidatus Moeniiplasma glomeromycotorum]MCE8168849.1 ribosomal protein S19 family protein [Candidatus Moeniiplasma glomeromycotorum]